MRDVYITFDSALNYHGGRLRNTAIAIRARSSAAVFPFCMESRYLDADTRIKRGPCTFVTVIHLPKRNYGCVRTWDALVKKHVLYQVRYLHNDGS